MVSQQGSDEVNIPSKANRLLTTTPHTALITTIGSALGSDHGHLGRTIWGGRKLIDNYGIKTDLENCAEAWMLSCFENFESTVADGEYAGKTLTQVIAAFTPGGLFPSP